LLRNKPLQRKVDFSLGFQLNHVRTMADGSHDDRQSDDTGDASHTPFEEVLHKIMERIANALSDGEGPSRRQISKRHRAGLISLFLIS
jgi:hypothetical protein